MMFITQSFALVLGQHSANMHEMVHREANVHGRMLWSPTQ